MLFTSNGQFFGSPEQSVQFHTYHSTSLVCRPETGPATFGSIIFRDLKLIDLVEMVTDYLLHHALHENRSDHSAKRFGL